MALTGHVFKKDCSNKGLQVILKLHPQYGVLFSTQTNTNFLSETASFRHNMKWARKAVCVAIKDSPVLKI